MRNALCFFGVLMTTALLEGGCQAPRERRVIVDPLTINPIYIKQDVNVRMEKECTASTQPSSIEGQPQR